MLVVIRLMSVWCVGGAVATAVIKMPCWWVTVSPGVTGGRRGGPYFVSD